MLHWLSDPSNWWPWMRTGILWYLIIAHVRHQVVIKRMKRRYAEQLALTAVARFRQVIPENTAGTFRVEDPR